MSRRDEAREILGSVYLLGLNEKPIIGAAYRDYITAVTNKLFALFPEAEPIPTEEAKTLVDGIERSIDDVGVNLAANTGSHV